MNVFKLDNFMGYQISQCQMCERKKTRVQKWDKLFNAWICINCILSWLRWAFQLNIKVINRTINEVKKIAPMIVRNKK